jgi:hypothetical protein
MKQISVEQARPGMILARPINDRQGRTIVKQGASLTQLYISRLAKWGIAELWVIEEGDEPVEAEPIASPRTAAPTRPAVEAASGPTASSAAEGEVRDGPPPGMNRSVNAVERIDAIFARVRDVPLMAALHDAVKRQLAGLTDAGGGC